MGEMRGMRGDHELIWMNGNWSGDPAAADLADAVASTWDTVEIIPLAELPADDDSVQVVGYIMDWVLAALYPDDGAFEVTLSQGMKSRTEGWNTYDASGRVY